MLVPAELILGSARKERFVVKAGRLAWGPCLLAFIGSVDHHFE